MKDKLIELFEMQKELDKAILEEHRLPTQHEMLLALFDELGEVCHAKKGDWCWWKSTQKPVYKQEVLEELADVLHFVLCYILHFGQPEESIRKVLSTKLEVLPKEKFFLCLRQMVQGVTVPRFMLVWFLNLASSCGFTFDDLYNAYKSKNETNFSRLENGY